MTNEPADPTPVVWFNAACSKCRTAQGILTEHSVDATYLDYLDKPPTRTELENVLSMIGTDDPRAIARRNEPLWADLGLDDATDDKVLAALTRHPQLIERPIVIVGDRAVVARPPELVLGLLTDPA